MDYKIIYRTADNWKNIFLPKSDIKYLEIGCLHGSNFISFYNWLKSINRHSNSILHAVDPWEDYPEYDEYINIQNENYHKFLDTVKDIPKHNIQIFKNYSHKIVPSLEDNFYDIIYIDGNHLPEYVLEDAVLAFRKLQKGGILIFDDYGYGGLDLTKRGIDAFTSAYRDKLEFVTIQNSQLFLIKK